MRRVQPGTLRIVFTVAVVRLWLNRAGLYNGSAIESPVGGVTLMAICRSH
jgi:hypothetical protein